MFNNLQYELSGQELDQHRLNRSCIIDGVQRYATSYYISKYDRKKDF